MTSRSSDGDHPALHTNRSESTLFRRGFSQGLAIGLISLVGVLVLAGSLLYGQGGDALFIDPQGRVGIGTDKPGSQLDVKGDLAVSGKIIGNGALVKGLIMMWHGTDIPKGWALCDGTSGTPDLRGRFIVGYDPKDGDYNVPGKTGGGGKTHTLTVEEMPAHAHSGDTDEEILRRRIPGKPGDTYGLVETLDIEALTWTHKHSFRTNSVGGGKPYENRPPYYVLAYIMYTGE